MKVIWILGLVAACGSDGPSYLKPPADAVTSCKLVRKDHGSITARNALWFDSAGRTIQSDGDDGSYTYAYDDQGRLSGANTPHGSITWTYDPMRITETYPGYSDAYELGSDGRVARYDSAADPNTFPRDTVDFSYDEAGHITSETGMHADDAAHAPLTTSEHRFTYDAQGRLISAFSNSSPTPQPTSYTYSEMSGSLTIQLAGNVANRVYSYEFDASNRIVHAGIDQTDVPASIGVSYSYADDTITAITDDHALEVDAIGACPALTTSLAPQDPLPIRLSNLGVALPNPPVDDFREGVY